MGPLAWAFILLAAGLTIICLEFVIPSGGVLGFLAFCSLVGSIIMGFLAGPKWGAMMMGINVLCVPAVLALAVKVWPYTPLGRKMLIQLPGSDKDVLVPEDEALRKLTGMKGVAKSKMLPSGAIVVGGRTYDAVSEGMPIDEGQVIAVVSVKMNQTVVRPSAGPIDDPSPEADEDRDPRLDDPLEKFGLDPFDDPMA